MTATVFDTITDVLVSQFQVEAAKVVTTAKLSDLGLDSLSLVEFVFALEDRLGLRIPEDKLDPRQAELTLDDVRRALDDALNAQGDRAGG
jgi:acyl carrier protein